MLDNFGLLEFFFLALLALLFFGPERLPQIGARLGRWLNRLTQYSKAFMTQWGEEALAISDAVAEVRGIRDEIRAAQAEIADSLNTARGDINQTIDDAKAKIREAQPNPQAILDGPPAAQPTNTGTAISTQTGSDEIARAKTEAIVSDLMARRRATVQERELSTSQATAEEAQPGTKVEETGEPVTPLLAPTSIPQKKIEPPAETETPEEKEKQESAFDRTQRVLDRLMGKASVEEEPSDDASSQQAALPEAGDEPVTEDERQAGEPQASDPAQATLVAPLTVTTSPPETGKPKTATAFDRTQRILDRLMGKKVPPEEEAPAEPDQAVKAVAGGEPSEAPAAVEMEKPVPAEQQPKLTPTVDLRQQARQAATRISYSDFQKLNIEVAMMRSELRALRQELQALQDIARQQKSESPASEGPEAVSVEEAA